ncbi:glycoside hydrolase superfamily [Pyrenochaeta sp. MPI-SDFR-AT-0127]|nr:glycoside hydrolase superfamily [Pyrenochaeta sp. MPI-SDFR-AT-0127]
MKLFTLLLIPQLALAASKIYTGFNYGALWAVEANAKQKADFIDGFNLARNLSTDIQFDSARLFTCKATGTLNDPTGAFDAAVETKTNLLLGFWITPPNRGEPTDEQVKNELIALEKGFEKHGQALADLIIGLSVGNEDVYRWMDTAESGVAADVVSQTIDGVKKSIAASSFAKYMKDKPIGHIDTAQHAVVDGADFIGMTAYPYWNNESIEKAKDSFNGSLEDVKRRAGDRPVWIAEIGWPFHGPQRSGAVASAENVQKFWKEVGCSVFGLYTTFWFELLKDSTVDQPDWGLIDIPSRLPRIKDLKCPGGAPGASNLSLINSQALSLVASTIALNATSSSTAPDQNAAPAPLSSSLALSMIATSAPLPTVKTNRKSTVHVSTTVYVTVQPTPSVLAPALESDFTSTEEITITITTTLFVKPSTADPPATEIPTDRPWCVTVADIDRNGNPVRVAGGPAGRDSRCSTPPTYNGFPYEITDVSAKPTHVPAETPWCVTMADVDGNGHPVPIAAGPAEAGGNCSEAHRYTGWSYTTTSQSSAPELPVTSDNFSFTLLSTITVSETPVLYSSSDIASSMGPVSNNLAQVSSSSTHSYCKAKSSQIAASSAAASLSSLSASPAMSTSVLSLTTSVQPSSGKLSQFNFPSATASSKEASTVTSDHGRKKRW